LEWWLSDYKDFEKARNEDVASELTDTDLDFKYDENVDTNLETVTKQVISKLSAREQQQFLLHLNNYNPRPMQAEE
jgi:hypothetical protein